MPQVAATQVESLLQNLALARPHEDAVYLADMVAPVVPVMKQSGKIGEIDPTFQAYRIVSSKTGPLAHGAKSDFDVSTSATYFSEYHEHWTMVGDEEKANADSAIQPFLDKTWLLMGLHKREKEAALLTLLAAQWTGAYTAVPTDKWDTYTAATSPHDYIQTKMNTVKLAGGVKPNAIAMDEFVFTKLMNHPDILDRLRYVVAAVPGVAGGVYQNGLASMKAAFSAIFGIAYVNVAENCLKNTAAEGATATLASIWSDSVFLYHYETPRVGSSPSLANFNWKVGVDGQATNGIRAEIYRNNGDRWDTIRVSTYRDIKELLIPTGFLLTNVLDAI